MTDEFHKFGLKAVLRLPKVNNPETPVGLATIKLVFWPEEDAADAFTLGTCIALEGDNISITFSTVYEI